MNDPNKESVACKAPTLLMGIGGGVAAYKSVEVASALHQSGLNVHVCMTDSACEFVTPLTFSAVSGNPAMNRLFPAPYAQKNRRDVYPHLYPATEASLFLLAPATANLMEKMAQGRGDDLLSTCMLSLPGNCQKFYCPAMNVEMWDNEAVQANRQIIADRGWIQIGPDRGRLACGSDGYGRMAEPTEIIDTLLRAAQGARQYAGLRVLILSGPTREYLDPVRFIGNSSTGKMGRALADEASAMGAEVDFVSGPVGEDQLPRGPHTRVHAVTGAEDMLAKANDLYDQADVILFAAAVADYTPVHPSDVKHPKQPKGFDLPLRPTPDIAANLNQRKKAHQVAIGFALQSHNGKEEAQQKMICKRFDGIILNHLDSLGGDTGSYDFRARSMPGENFSHWGSMNKRACARRILDEAAAMLPQKTKVP